MRPAPAPEPKAKYLLDVNALLAAIIRNHPHHSLADNWVRDKQLVLCPICQVGFLRISTHPRVYNLAMTLAEEALRDFTAKNRAQFISDDLSAARLGATSSDAVTDFYLAELAQGHQLKLATLDTRIAHAAVEVIT